jgi:outer membrane lipoprotein-sorting protein
MKTKHLIPFVLVFAAVGIGVHHPKEASAEAKALGANQIVTRVLEADPWGLGGAEVKARAVVTDKNGKKRELGFEAKSRRHAAPLSKSIIAFKSPADVAGMKFLQVQKEEGDDERFLYTPELKRSRRIAGANRSEAFMGTDFSYADLDRRDLRQGSANLKADETLGKFDCYHVDVTPKNSDAIYSKIELWVRKDNLVPIKWNLFDKSGTNTKTLVAKELQRLGGKWFMTRSTMTDNQTSRTTELLLENIDPKEDIPLETFSVREIEKG